MKGLNQVQLIGNLGESPEMRFSPTGKQVTTFSMATSRRYIDDDGSNNNDTTWHRIVTWEKLAEACNNSLDKGSAVFIQGRINNRSWEDKQGVKHFVSEIVADTVIFLDKKPVKEVDQAQDEAAVQQPDPVELPF